MNDIQHDNMDNSEKRSLSQTDPRPCEEGECPGYANASVCAGRSRLDKNERDCRVSVT